MEYLCALISLMTLTFSRSGALSPNGSHVCSRTCKKLEWPQVQVNHPCENSTCTFHVREPLLIASTCYECCQGWRQTTDESCDTECLSGSAGILTCAELPDGWYQLCDSCRTHARCMLGRLDRMTCPHRKRWDDQRKKCVKRSKTCYISEDNEITSNHIPTTENDAADLDVINEVTNEVDVSANDVMQDCSDVTCPRPGRCVMLYVDSVWNLTPKCICPAGMRLSSGVCVTSDVCVITSPCAHGACRPRRRYGGAGFVCRCDAGWRGRRCHKPQRKKERRAGRNRVAIHLGPDRGEDYDEDRSWNRP